MKRLRRTLALSLLVLALSANALAAEGTAEEAPLYDDTVAGWHIMVENTLVREEMKNVTVELGYTDVQTSEYEKAAPEGKAFCMVKLLLEKAGSKEKIVWDDLVLTDKAGQEYHRIDDSFFAELGMKHMTSLDLNFGINEGWIAFEVDKDAEDLTLSYAFKEETFLCELEAAE